ncbi:hypothetical protein REPUB_Repub15cG0057900 [Reevesia pubescens]
MGSSRESSAQITSWVSPYQGAFKINVDASLPAGSSIACLGMVARYRLGEVVLLRVAKRVYVSSILHVEVLSIKWGLELGLEHGLRNVCVESDSFLAVVEIKKDYSTMWDKKGLVLDILYIVVSLRSC